jgi:hypothetical protein
VVAQPEQFRDMHASCQLDVGARHPVQHRDVLERKNKIETPCCRVPGESETNQQVVHCGVDGGRADNTLEVAPVIESMHQHTPCRQDKPRVARMSRGLETASRKLGVRSKVTKQA